MSGDSFDNQFDKDFKDYIAKILEDSILDSDASTSPTPVTEAGTPELPEETLNAVDHVYYTDEILTLLNNTPADEMPPMLANAMVSGDNHTPNEGVYDLIANVIEEHADLIAQHGHRGIIKNGSKFVIDTHINSKRIILRFDTLEQAALAYLYARNKDLRETRTAYSRRSLNSLLQNPYYNALNNKLASYLQQYKNKGIDIAAIVDAKLLNPTEDKVYKNRSKKRHRRI